jgi:integrase
MGPRLRLPQYVHAFIDNRGRPRYYVRRRGFKRVPLPGLPWSVEFMGAYEAALAGAPRLAIGASRRDPGSVNGAVARYLASEAFGRLAPTTQAMRRALLKRFCKDHGDKRLAMMELRHVGQLLERLRLYPQRNMLKALRGLMAFAMAERLIDVDPTAGYKPKRMKDAGGFQSWTDDDVAAFEMRHPVGSKARLALALLLYTGQRRGDVVLLGRQHVRNGVLSLRQSKTGAQVDIPVLPELQIALDAAATGMTFLMTDYGAPFTAAGFGGWFRRRCNEAGLRGLSAHGLRKLAATRFADRGATVHELMAWFGWTTLREAERYTRSANRKALAQGVVQRLKLRT